MTHVDIFFKEGTEDFVKRIRAGIAEVLTVSKVGRGKFRFTGWDLEKYEDVVTVFMKDYVQSLNKIVKIRKAYQGTKSCQESK